MCMARPTLNAADLETNLRQVDTTSGPTERVMSRRTDSSFVFS